MLPVMSPDPTTPTAPTKPRPSQRIRVYRYFAGLALLALGAASVTFADHAPWLGPLCGLLGVAAGKYLGVPHSDLIRMGLQLMTPEQAVAAFKWLTAGYGEAAAGTL